MKTLHTSVIALLVSFFDAGKAIAAVPDIGIPCPTNLIGCGEGPSNVIFDNIPDFTTLMLLIASGSAVLFIAWAGFQMVIALGNESKIGQQKMALIYSLFGLAIAILSQLAVSIVGTEPRLGAIRGSDLPLDVITVAIGLILALFNTTFLGAIIYGGIRMVYAQGKSDDFNTGRKIIVWSIVGAIIVNLSNALVQALARIFGV